jgi:hypothetical protein
MKPDPFLLKKKSSKFIKYKQRKVFEANEYEEHIL